MDTKKGDKKVQLDKWGGSRGLQGRQGTEDERGSLLQQPN